MAGFTLFKSSSVSPKTASAPQTPRSSFSLDSFKPASSAASTSSPASGSKKTLSFKTSALAYAVKGDCRKAPVDFLAQRYAILLNRQFDSLSESDQEEALEPLKQAHSRLSRHRGDGVIDNAIFSEFHSNCKAKPPHRSPDEVCGSAKSIACFAPWDHRKSVLGTVHAAVVETLDDIFQDMGSDIRQAMVQDVESHCPDECQSWEEPFQKILLKWEQREHSNAYGNRVPNCINGRHGW
ncbi:hypothetical protein BGW38_011006 [Lunasporangiospora selenospora]|uniref:Uncharacterized protein n=1 Tax=Lunasporangiospora selenospora TaxID=979761 RepID=A0A9P6FW32_9FUNG|nr:hypothetical protein BGW38_011006 [Lunasporangiospora selenospora]